MFEKVLQQIEREPDLKTIHSFLVLVGQEADTTNQAQALAQLAKVRLKQNAFDAIRTIQSAFRLAPRNGIVLDTMQSMFKELGCGELTESINNFRKVETAPPVGVEFSVPDLEQEKTVASRVITKPVVETPSESTPQPKPLCLDLESSKQRSIDDGVLELDFDTTPKEWTQTVRRVPLEMPAPIDEQPVALVANTPQITPSAQTPNVPEVPSEESYEQNRAPHITFSEIATNRNYDSFVQFLQSNTLDFRLLEYAEGFSDSTLGLIHFIHYLVGSGKIQGSAIQTATVALRKIVHTENVDIKCRVRFLELLEGLKTKST